MESVLQLESRIVDIFRVVVEVANKISKPPSGERGAGVPKQREDNNNNNHPPEVYLEWKEVLEAQLVLLQGIQTDLKPLKQDQQKHPQTALVELQVLYLTRRCCESQKLIRTRMAMAVGGEGGGGSKTTTVPKPLTLDDTTPPSSSASIGQRQNADDRSQFHMTTRQKSKRSCLEVAQDDNATPMVSKPRKRVGRGSSGSAVASEPPRPDEGVVVTTTNPLMTQSILQQLFKRCDKKELPNISRMVCKQWYETSLPIWRQSPVCLKSLESISRFLNDIHGGGANNGEDEEDDNAYVCNYYEFKGLRRQSNFRIMGPGEKYDWCIPQAFWDKCGKWITKLEVSCFRLRDDVESFKAFALCKYTPVLETLKIYWVDAFQYGGVGTQQESHFSSSSEEEEEWYENETYERKREAEISVNPNLKSLEIVHCHYDFPFWTAMLLHYPNLEHLRLAHLYSKWKDEVAQMFNAISSIREGDRRKLVMKSLDILTLDSLNWNDDYSNDDDSNDSSSWNERNVPTEYRIIAKSMAAFFLNNSFALESLALDVEEEDSFHSILRLQSKSLKRLTIAGSRPLHNFHFPKMESLERLKCFEAPLASLDFLKQCPNLRSLILEIRWRRQDHRNDEHGSSIVSRTNEQYMKGVVLPLLTEFRCDHESNYDAKDISRLRKWMPNMKSLQLSLSKGEPLRMVFKVWPDLEELELGYGADIDDEVITGVPNGCDDEARLYPNITDLKELRTLKLKEAFSQAREKWQVATKFTEKSVLSGFLHLPKLKTLSFKARSLTSNAIYLLKKNVPEAIIECKDLKN